MQVGEFLLLDRPHKGAQLGVAVAQEVQLVWRWRCTADSTAAVQTQIPWRPIKAVRKPST